MTDTYGPTSQEPFAFYDPDWSCLRTSQGTFLSDSMKSSVTLPKWGSMRSGALYERPTLVRPTDANGSSLLPTPRSQNGETRNMTAWERPLDQPQNLENALARVPAVQLLPTPTARDWKDTGDFTYRDKSILPHEIQRLGEERWGIYAPAIARWEAVLGRPAPEPTDEKRRLNPAFVAWMMGLPENWLHGTRTQQLKQCGNAVVPQQGAYALRALVSRFNAAVVEG